MEWIDHYSVSIWNCVYMYIYIYIGIGIPHPMLWLRRKWNTSTPGTKMTTTTTTMKWRRLRQQRRRRRRRRMTAMPKFMQNWYEMKSRVKSLVDWRERMKLFSLKKLLFHNWSLCWCFSQWDKWDPAHTPNDNTPLNAKLIPHIVFQRHKPTKYVYKFNYIQTIWIKRLYTLIAFAWKNLIFNLAYKKKHAERKHKISKNPCGILEKVCLWFSLWT